MRRKPLTLTLGAVGLTLCSASWAWADGDLGRALRYAQGVLGDDAIEGLEDYVTEAPEEALWLLLYEHGDEAKNPYETLGSTRLSLGQLKPSIMQASVRHGVSPALIDAVIRTESGYRPQAVSRVGAQGLMQLMPKTAAAMGVRDALDPHENIMGGARYLRRLLDRFGKIHLAVAAYNAGPGNVAKYGGVPPFRETQRYVKTVLHRYKRSPLAGEQYLNVPPEPPDAREAIRPLPARDPDQPFERYDENPLLDIIED